MDPWVTQYFLRSHLVVPVSCKSFNDATPATQLTKGIKHASPKVNTVKLRSKAFHHCGLGPSNGSTVVLSIHLPGDVPHLPRRNASTGIQTTAATIDFK